MKIKQIQIENFRSIKSETISFDKNCLILIGKNEAGKSNFLKAIAALFGEYQLNNRDKRKRINNETITDYCIYAEFEYNDDDIKLIENILLEKYPVLRDITFSKGKYLSDYIRTELKYIYYRIDVETGSSAKFVHSSFKQLNILPDQKLYKFQNGLTTEIHGNEVQLFTFLIPVVDFIYKETPYNCVFWHYDNNLLLPEKININEFKRVPSNCKALENLFIMCNRPDISREFKDAIDNDGDYTNLLDQVSSKVTKVFRKIWSDFNDTAIELRADGENILVKVVNNANYSFADRSDGFKKFISILLMLSTKARSNRIDERDIILIDEPDQSLYPTGARFLRDELLEISKKAHVIYSTHSQYMIDSNCIDRHLIVEKKNDVTAIKQSTENSPFCDDELLRRAIGSSIFECLKDKNIIFEGWLDKEIFNKYRFFIKDKRFDSFGITYLHGIAGASTLASIMLMAEKKFIIVADSDKVSVDKRKAFERDYPECKDSWLAYGDEENSVSTLEDFLQEDYIEESIKSAGYPDFSYNKSKKAIENIEKCFPDKDERQKMKKILVDNIEKKNIKESYSIFVNALFNKLTTL